MVATSVLASRCGLSSLLILAFGIAAVACGATAAPTSEPPHTVEVAPANSAPSPAASRAEPAAFEICPLTPENTSIRFVGSKVTGDHEGSFGSFHGTIRVNLWRPVASLLMVAIDTRSLTTDSEKLSAHLKSADFFDVERFPEAGFFSTTIAARGDKDRYTLSGRLTLHGQTKEISFPVALTLGNGTLAAEAEASLDRRDFHLEYPGKLDDLIRNEVKIRLKIQASCRKAEPWGAAKAPGEAPAAPPAPGDQPLLTGGG